MKIYAVAYTDRDGDNYDRTRENTDELYLHRDDAQHVVDDLNEQKRVALWQSALTQARIRVNCYNELTPEHNILADAGFRKERRDLLPVPTLADIPAPTLTSSDGYWSIEELEVKE